MTYIVSSGTLNSTPTNILHLHNHDSVTVGQVIGINGPRVGLSTRCPIAIAALYNFCNCN